MGDDKNGRGPDKITKEVTKTLAQQRKAFHGYCKAEHDANAGFEETLKALGESRAQLEALQKNPLQFKS